MSAFVVAIAVACTAKHTVDNRLDPTIDTSLFAAVVRMVADSAKEPLRVDPRLIGADPLELAAPSTRGVATPEIIETRRRTIERLGVTVGSSDLPRKCSSVLSAGDEDGREISRCTWSSSGVYHGACRSDIFHDSVA
jgi:hypothetical protein